MYVNMIRILIIINKHVDSQKCNIAFLKVIDNSFTPLSAIIYLNNSNF